MPKYQDFAHSGHIEPESVLAWNSPTWIRTHDAFVSGEVVIRQALTELDMWEVEAKFSFVGHQVPI
jgi:hypothetical protein